MVHQSGRRLSERELRSAVGVVRSVRNTRRAGRWKDTAADHLHGPPLSALIEPQLARMSPQSLGLEGYEEMRAASGIVLLRYRVTRDGRLEARFPQETVGCDS
jgi:hypothetical protein